MRLTIARGLTLAVLAARSGYSLDLKKETIDAWNSYIARENSQVTQRALSDASFFWADQSSARCARIRAGEVLVEQVGKPDAERVPGGLIHHWISAAFIPKVTLEDVFAVTRDYPHYKNYYKPGVAGATTTMKSDYKDEFTIWFDNPSLLSKTSLQGTYVSNFFRLNGNRWYSISETTSMCEIKDFGYPNEKKLSPDHGSGYIWRLYSTARTESRNGGVLLEIEAIALSREIPAALHWCLDPIVRRISRDSIEKSITQTADAVRERVRACAAGNRIIDSGPCSRNANNSDLRAQGFPAHPGR